MIIIIITTTTQKEEKFRLTRTKKMRPMLDADKRFQQMFGKEQTKAW